MNVVRRFLTLRIPLVWWYAIVVGIMLCGVATQYNGRTPWKLAIGSATTRSFGAELQGSEFTKYFGGVTWYRQAPQGSDVGMPHIAVARIVAIRLFTRLEEPPTDIILHAPRFTVPISNTGELRRVWFYIPANQTVRVDCNNDHVMTVYLKNLCVAIVDIRGYAPTDVRRIATWWIFVLPIVLWVVLFGVIGHRFRGHAVIPLVIMITAGILGWYIIVHYPLQLLAWAPGISSWLAVSAAIFWVATHPRITHQWVWGLLVLAVLMRLMVYSAPGADGVDRKVHARQLESVIYGDIYLENIGTLVNSANQPRQVQTYPYPPATYLFIAPLILLLSPVMTFNYFVGAIAIIIEATLVLGIVRVILHHRLGSRTAWYSAIVFLFFPQAYVMHSYPVVAQAIAQWASWWFVCLTLLASETPSLRQRIFHGLVALLAITGHFGAFLTMSMMQGIQWVIGTMRRSAWIWIIVTIAMSMLYYSQYVVLIAAQSRKMVQDLALSRLDVLQQLWVGGIDDHYSWVVFVIGLLGLASPRLRNHTALRHTVWAGAGTLAVLAILRVVFFVNPTRIIIFVAPIIAIGMGLMAREYQRHRAGVLMVVVLAAYLSYTSLTTWMTLNIDQQLIRWILPQ